MGETGEGEGQARGQGEKVGAGLGMPSGTLLPVSPAGMGILGSPEKLPECRVEAFLPQTSIKQQASGPPPPPPAKENMSQLRSSICSSRSGTKTPNHATVRHHC